MTPSFVYRIDSIIQAMGDIVLPAIQADKSLAMEQAQLVIAHLHLMKRQLPMATVFDRMELEAASDLGRQLVELAAGNANLDVSKRAVEDAIAESRHTTDSQQAMRSINGATENLMRAMRLHSSRSAIGAMTAAVLAHGREQSLRNRIWFASNGFDSERDSLPGYEYLLTAKR